MTVNYSLPEIPAYITVHLGKLDADGENVTVQFPDYIKTDEKALNDIFERM